MIAQAVYTQFSDYVKTPTGLILPEDVAEQRYCSRSPTGIDLFAGCGGFSLGFKKAGFEILAACEWDDDIVVSPDGRLVAAAMQDRSVQLLPIDGGQARAVQGVNGLTPVSFCGDGSLLVYRSGEIPSVRITKIDLATGSQTPWRTLSPAYRAGLWGIQPIRVAPDCESYAYTVFYWPSTVLVVSGLQ